MAVYRQVHVDFWQDGFVLDLTPEEKYFYLYLMTNSKTTQCGIYELPMRIIETETGYNRETVEKLLSRFEEYGKIKYNHPTKEIMVINWLKFNKITSPKVKACVMKELKTIKHVPFIRKFYELCKRYGYSIDTLSIDYGEEKEEEKEKEEINNSSSQPPADQFLEEIESETEEVKACSEIERYYLEKKGNIAFNVSTAEYKLILDLVKRNIPVSKIKQEIDKAFAYKKQKQEPINSFRYCWNWITTTLKREAERKEVLRNAKSVATGTKNPGKNQGKEKLVTIEQLEWTEEDERELRQLEEEMQMR